jgi:hypothetical protein
LRSDQDINASAPTNSEIVAFYAYSWSPFSPRLVISWHTPNPSWKHIVNLTWYSNSSGAWTEYYKSYINSNGTTTVPAVNFSGVKSYFWHLEWESNHTNNGSSQIFTFTTVNASGGMILISNGVRDRFVLGLALGGMLFLVIGMVLWKKKRK